MRTTLLGSLLTAVRHNTARGAEDVRLFEEGSVYFDRPHGREPTAAEARSTPLPDERMHLAALMTGRLRPASWGETTPPSGGLLRRQGRAGDAARRAARGRGASCAASDPFLHPGRAARVLVARRGRRLARRGPPGRRLASGTSAGSRASSSTSARCSRTPIVVPAYEDLTSFPAIRQDLAFWVPADRTAAELVEVVRGAGGKLLRDVRVFDVYAREGQTSLAVRLEFRAGDRTLTDEEIAPQRDKIVEAVRDEARGRAPWLEVAVLGAVGYAGAIAAQLLYRHPFFELAHVTARAEAGQRLDDVHPRTRVPLELEVFDVARHAVDAAVVAYPHGAAAPVVAELRARGHARRRPLAPTSGCATARSTTTGTASTRRPSSSGRASTGCRSSRARRCAGADLVANPGCYPTAALLGLGAAGAGGRDRRRRHRRASRASRAPAARATARDALHLRRRERLALQDQRPPPHAGDRAGARRARRRR